MIKITKEFNGNVMTIDLTEEDIRCIISDCVIGPRTGAQPAAREPKQYTMPKTIRTGCFKDHKDEVLRMLDQGMSRHKIAVYFGTTDSTVRRWVERWRTGTEVKRRGGRAGLTLDDGFDMMRKHACGMTNAQIAAIYGINQNTVTKWIAKAKVALNAPAA